MNAELARLRVGEAADPVERARRVVTAVGDSVWDDPYAVSGGPRGYRAGAVAVTSRLGVADVGNHLRSVGLRQRDTPAFDRALRAQYGQFITEPAPPADEFSLSTGRRRVSHAKHHARRPAHRENDRGTCDIDSR
ncbi:MAG: hypothetical protein SV966_04140 [Actinomycetota bacterium]|nr:hypothetical protein [Actinomycetota bacterium]